MTHGDRHTPRPWRWVRLAEICLQDRQVVEPASSEATRRPYLSLEHIESNTGRILPHTLSPAEDEGRSSTFAFDERHVLYGKLRPYLNKVALPSYAGRCTTELIPLLPLNVNREYLAWLLRRPQTVHAAMQGKTGSRMPRADLDDLFRLLVPLPPLDGQHRIACLLNEQMVVVERVRAAAEAQLELVHGLVEAYIGQSLETEGTARLPLGEVLVEVTNGVGEKWADYPLWGATREGLAPAKENIGKNPARYKLMKLRLKPPSAWWFEATWW